MGHTDSHAIPAMTHAVGRAMDAAQIMRDVATRTLEDDFSRSFYRGIDATVWTPAFADKACSVYDVIQTIDKEGNETFDAMREIVCKASMGLDVQELAANLIDHLKTEHAAKHAEVAL